MKKISTMLAAIISSGVLGAGLANAAPAFTLPSTGRNEIQALAGGTGTAQPPEPVLEKRAVPTGAATRGFTDVSYSFDREKVAAAQDSFHFLRSFVDYFYLLAKANRGSLRAVSAADGTAGWCVGDAHPENFGVLIQNNGRSVFTMNDVDDSGPCPVVYDLYRLMASARLYDENTKLDKLVNAYVDGLQGNAYDTPAPVTAMLAKSQKKGTAPDPKKVSGDRLVRDGKMHELTSGELGQIKAALASLGGALAPGAKLLDAVSTSKVGGGSGGLLRYEVLLDNGGQLLHLEFKEEIKPSIYPVAAGPIPAASQRIPNTILMDQGPGASAFYRVVNIAGKDMLVRPRFDGNVGMSLDKQSGKDNKDIIRCEAYVLGVIHSRSVQRPGDWAGLIQNIPASAWENDVQLMTSQFDLKFSQVK